MLQRQILIPSAKGDRADRYKRTQAVGLARTAARTCSPKLEEHDPDAPTGQTKNGINSNSHPTATSRLAGDMVSRNMAATMQADHRTGAEPRTVPRHKDPSNASREPQRHACDTIAHA
jgi:hypothetical protein